MYNKIFKRILDFALSLIAIIVFTPLLIPICIILVVTGEHQIIYFQNRLGKSLKPFRIWKFTTMLKNSESMGNGIITVREDPRVLPVGKYLRKTKINEIPQLVNILIGDMSIVGPRPLIYNPYSQGVGEKIYSNKPGLTGIGSIILRDEEFYISNTTMDKKEFYDKWLSPFKGQIELWYYENKSLIVDLKIVIITAWVILYPKSDIVYRLFNDLPPFPDDIIC
jgi:lipopolysaccharide/colanic/teichoic acid biosynthesis glycosyltransferase